MARYTVELRTLMNNVELMEKLNKALSTYPIFKPKTTNPDALAVIPTREVLNQKLLNHYRKHEIGFETIADFCEELEITMNEIMPYYNQMFNTVEIMANLDNPFDNVDVIENFTETHTGETKTNDSGSSSSSATDSTNTTSSVNTNSKNIKNETPQSEIINFNDIDNVMYADEINWNRNISNDTAETNGESSSSAQTTNESNSETSGTTEHTFTKKGNQGVNTYAHDMIEFRTSIIDVTMQIINDKRIKELFMLVY